MSTRLISGGNLPIIPILPSEAAARDRSLELVEPLLKIGIDINEREDLSFRGGTPLYIAFFNGHIEVVKKLLKHKANPKIRGFTGDDATSLAEKKAKEHINKTRKEEVEPIVTSCVIS